MGLKASVIDEEVLGFMMSILISPVGRSLFMICVFASVFISSCQDYKSSVVVQNESRYLVSSDLIIIWCRGSTGGGAQSGVSEFNLCQDLHIQQTSILPVCMTSAHAARPPIWSLFELLVRFCMEQRPGNGSFDSASSDYDVKDKDAD